MNDSLELLDKFLEPTETVGIVRIKRYHRLVTFQLGDSAQTIWRQPDEERTLLCLSGSAFVLLESKGEKKTFQLSRGESLVTPSDTEVTLCNSGFFELHVVMTSNVLLGEADRETKNGVESG